MRSDAFVTEMVRRYSADDLDVAHELCDRHDPDRVALRVVGPGGVTDELTFEDLRRTSTELAAGLAALGLARGDRVATYLARGPALTQAVVAIHRLGATHVPLFTAFSPRVVADRLGASGSTALVTDAAGAVRLAEVGLPSDVVVLVDGTPPRPDWHAMDQVRSAEPVPPPGPRQDVPMVLMHTSGTTGPAKSVAMPPGFLAAWRTYFHYGLDHRADDVFWCHADPGWTLGLYAGLLMPLLLGAPVIALPGRFDADLVATALRTCGVTNFVSAPTIYRSLRQTSLTAEPVQLRCASSAGEPLTPDVHEWSGRALGVRVHDHYGQTELGMVVNDHHHPDLSSSGSTGMGRPMPGWRLDVHGPDGAPVPTGQPGRLVVDVERSPLMWFRGYEGAARATRERFTGDGRWYLTGDLATRDENDEFRFASREDDVIIMAGYRIGPFDVERAVCTHPAVVECAVVAAPDDRLGEVIEAHVVLAPGTAGTDELVLELQDRVRQGYAAHAYPRRVHFTASLPKTPSGKVQRSALRRRPR